MTELGEGQIPIPLEAIRKEEHDFEDARLESSLAKHLFHNKHLDAALEVWERDQYRAYVERLQREFLEDKRGKNMGDRFDMAISDKYLGKIHVVKLGETIKPDENGHVDGLRLEYRQLIKWMSQPEQKNIVVRELSRIESGRNLTVRHPVNPDIIDLAVVARNRPLAEITVYKDNLTIKAGIAKRMVFLASAKNMAALMMRDPSLESEHTLTLVEEWLNAGIGSDLPIRAPIQTTYYLATDIVGPMSE